MSDNSARLFEALADRYRIERELGHGGMATVYLAMDPRHHRQVAVKVLRPELTAILGTERFLKEIETTARLQHPHIVPLFDSGEAGSLLYYVMPYVEGESLRDRLTREKQLPIADALRIATEIASALDYAHRRGILHRDIKPENILLHDGRAQVADFGIALAMRNAGGSRLTETGLSLGTPQYMSPEQATAERDLDARSDVYALGAVTYEMLTGEPPFMGNTTQALIAKLMTEAPRPLSVLRKAVPPDVESAVLTALEKLPADRWASAAEYAAALGGNAQPMSRGTATPAPSAFPRVTHGSRVTVPLVILTLAATAFALWSAFAKHPTAPGGIPTRATIPLGQELLLAQDGLPFDIAADGSEIVYSGDSAGTTQLYLRPMGSFEGHAIPGTEGASLPFLSPDGKWIGFFAEGKLRKVGRDGGAPIVLADAPNGGDGAAWGDDGTILYALRDAALYRVSDRGGQPIRIPVALGALPSPADSALYSHPVGFVRWPSFLPDGKHALVTTNTWLIGVVTLASGELRLLRSGRKARYLPTGHLLYDEEEGRMRVVRFDLNRLEVTGGPLPAFEAFRGPGSGAAQFAVSQNGTLVYVAGGFNRTLVLVDRNGRETPTPLPPRGYRFPRFSPDGERVAVTIDPRPSNIWVVDLGRGQLLRLTSEGHNIKPVWSPDGERIIYSSGGLRWMRWRSGGAPQPVLANGDSRSYPMFATFWGRDGRIVAQLEEGNGRDIVSIGIGDSAPTPVAATAAVESQGMVSPDGRWLCLRSNQSGSDEIYVRPYPAGVDNILVSTGGGADPRWSADGKELYYREGTRIMTVPVRTGASFEMLGKPRMLFTGGYDFSQQDNWDVAPDGRFIMVRGDPASRGQFRLVLNWFAELARADGGK